MNRIITTLVMAGLFFACKPKSENIKPEEEITCKDLSFKQTGRDNVVEVEERFTYEYDAKGNKIKMTKYTKNQGVETKSSENEYTYNAANQLIRQVINSDSETGVLKKEYDIFYEYHNNGKIKKLTAFHLDSTVPSTIAEFNEKGNSTLIQYEDGTYHKLEYNAADLVSKQTKYYANNKTTNEYQYEYNAQNLEIKASSYVNSVLTNYYTFEYNAKGQLITKIWYNANGTINTKYITEYTGESYKINYYNPENELTSYTTTEILNGLVMKESSYSNNILLSYAVYTYDNHKNVTKREAFNGNSVMTQRQEWSFQCD